MPRGGKRRGAGRKRGRLNNRTIAHKELASAAAQEGITPLELMTLKLSPGQIAVLERASARDG
jgi:hypothetical protein